MATQAIGGLPETYERLFHVLCRKPAGPVRSFRMSIPVAIYPLVEWFDDAGAHRVHLQPPPGTRRDIWAQQLDAVLVGDMTEITDLTLNVEPGAHAKIIVESNATKPRFDLLLMLIDRAEKVDA